MVLEQTAADRCASTGLNGCPQMTDGILLYGGG
jgi:hypothetical protein